MMVGRLTFLVRWSLFRGHFVFFRSGGCNTKLMVLTPWMFPKIVVPPNHPILIGFSIINHPFWGTLIFGNTPIHPSDFHRLCRNQEACWISNASSCRPDLGDSGLGQNGESPWLGKGYPTGFRYIYHTKWNEMYVNLPYMDPWYVW